MTRSVGLKKYWVRLTPHEAAVVVYLAADVEAWLEQNREATGKTLLAHMKGQP